MKLYLVSLDLDVAGIGRRGFVPAENLDWVRSGAHPEVVILTSDEATARADAQDWGTGMFVVESDDLNNDNLFPTHRFLVALGLSNGFENFKLETPRDIMFAATLAQTDEKRREILTLWYALNYERFKNRWSRSMKWGEVAHKGTVPAKALRFVPVAPPATFPRQIMYHGTTAAALPSILREGLKPRTIGRRGEWEGLLYLTSSLDIAVGMSRLRNDDAGLKDPPVVIEIKGAALDTAQCFPDEWHILCGAEWMPKLPSDLLEEARNREQPFTKITPWFYEQPREEWRSHWPRSLTSTGNIAYEGTIAPEHIRVVAPEKVLAVAKAGAKAYDELRVNELRAIRAQVESESAVPA